jgi:hypothetical protein
MPGMRSRTQQRNDRDRQPPPPDAVVVSGSTVAGLALAMLAALLAGANVDSAYKPIWLLSIEARSADQPCAQAALAEVMTRLQDDRISAGGLCEPDGNRPDLAGGQIAAVG